MKLECIDVTRGAYDISKSAHSLPAQTSIIIPCTIIIILSIAVLLKETSVRLCASGHRLKNPLACAVNRLAVRVKHCSLDCLYSSSSYPTFVLVFSSRAQPIQPTGATSFGAGKGIFEVVLHESTLLSLIRWLCACFNGLKRTTPRTH